MEIAPYYCFDFPCYPVELAVPAMLVGPCASLDPCVMVVAVVAVVVVAKGSAKEKVVVVVGVEHDKYCAGAGCCYCYCYCCYCYCGDGSFETCTDSASRHLPASFVVGDKSVQYHYFVVVVVDDDAPMECWWLSIRKGRTIAMVRPYFRN